MSETLSVAEFFEKVILTANDLIWSNALIILCIGTGIYFSIRTKFVQVRFMKDMISQLFTEGSSDKGVSPFQAFSIAIAGRVGTGNIAGVATAIAMGGPGAVFWMWAIAFLGSSTAFIEATLGQIYKVEKNGNYRGGPAYYIERGMGKKWYAALFAVCTIVACALFLPGVQSNSIAQSMNSAFDFDPLWVGLGVVLFLVLIIIGDVKRIGKFSELAVPFMAGAYILMALVIIGLNIEQLPAMIKLILSSAFGAEATFGGILGSAIAWGVKRGIYSNEAGQGTAPHAAAAAATTHPAKQGILQAFSVYIDTLFVCTATALMILFTGMYNVSDGNGGFLQHNLPGVEEGALFTQAAISAHFPALGHGFVALALLFFAFTTILAYYFIAESNLYYLREKKMHPAVLWTLRILFLTSVVFGSVTTGGNAWALGDIGVGLMAWLNLIAVLILQKKALITLKDYEQQKKEGRDPVFEPEKLGIKNTSEW
ncbi:alanine/glycine:cation symporter family protein [Chryseobacterium sp.]|uniref:alanine/glycine:cation symporter family protein n=1 Tax=Chryseobacterium sp. TaxID=1871047 RepID=UPI0012A9C46F|nr:alanine/glycine:cation symporter family protein [Chryseobacterium sp.]QFG52930.1 alanine:cation symporter family protein [Chryseobacterium sp.]